MFLTEQELADLTGTEQPSAQERILREWGLTVFRNRRNRIMLSREAVTRWQLGEKASKPAREPQLRKVA